MHTLSILLSLILPATLCFSTPVYVSTLEGDLAIFDPVAWKLSAQMQGLDHPPALAFEKNPNRAWTQFRGSASLQKLALDQALQLPTALPLSGTPKDVAWIRPTGPLAFIIEQDSFLHRIHPEGLALSRTTLALPGTPRFFAYPPNPNLLAVILEQPDSLCLVDTRQWKIRQTIPLPYPAWAVAFSHDGRWMAASHEDRGLISLVDLRGKQLARRLEVGENPRGLAVSPDGKRLWVAHQMGNTGGVSAIAVTANAVTQSFRVVGKTYDLAYLPGDSSSPAKLVVAAWVPEAEKTGMLYALNLDLTHLISNQPLDGKPYKIYFPPPAQIFKRPTAATPPLHSTAPEPITFTARSKADSKPNRHRNGLLRGGFYGKILFDKTNLKNPKGKVEAVNHRGRRYLGDLLADGRFQIQKLPWGRYQLIFEIDGYHRQVLTHQLLAFTGSAPIKILLRKEFPAPTPVFTHETTLDDPLP